MSIYNYANIAATALRMIVRFGQAVTITTRVQGAYNASTSAATVAETTQSTRGAPVNYEDSEVDGSLVQRGDIKMMIPGRGVTKPSINDFMTLSDSSKFIIKGVESVPPAGTPLIYICQVRR